MSQRVRLIPLRAVDQDIDLGDVTELSIIIQPGERVTFATDRECGYCVIDEEAGGYVLTLTNL